MVAREDLVVTRSLGTAKMVCDSHLMMSVYIT